MRIKPSSYFLIFLVLLGLFGIIESLTFHYFQAMALPLAMSSLIFILTTIELTRELRSKGKTETAIKAEPKGEAKARVALRRFGLLLGWVVGFTLGIYLLGFVIAIPLFVFSYLKMQRRGWRIALPFAVITLAVIYGMFEVALKAPLYKGLIFGG